MTGLNHSFLIINKETYSLNKYQEYKNSNYITLHDDFIQAIYRSQKWIKTVNLESNKQCDGLSLYGPTIIKEEGIKTAESIFKAWLSLIQNAPDNFELGSYLELSEEKNLNDIKLEPYSFQKDEIIPNLKKLLIFFEIVKNSNGTKWLLHFSI